MGAAIIFQGVRATLDHNPVKNVVAVRVLIGAPPAGGALGDRLACLCLETVLKTTHQFDNTDATMLTTQINKETHCK